MPCTPGARERGPSSAHTGLPPLAQARPKAQGLQANRPCSTSGRRHPAKLRHSQCSFYAVLSVVFLPFSVRFFMLGILGATLAQPAGHRITRILGRGFRPRPLPETASRSEHRFRNAVSVCEPRWESAPHSKRSFRDVVSARAPAGKAHPGLKTKCGTRFPLEGRSGNGIPFWSRNLGRGFRQGPQRESASHSEHQFRSELRHPRSHISTNEISLMSPLLAAAS